MKKTIYITLFSLLLISCEKVINIDLNSSDPQIVIEGTITNQPGPYTIKITETTDYFNPSDNPLLTNAVINISDNEGNFETLLEIEPGVYQTSDIQGVPGRTYDLYVNIDGQEFRASSYMPEITPIDSLSYEESPFTPRGNSEDYYYVTCYFLDTENIENYYRIKLYKNFKLSDNFYLIDDQLQDGNYIDYGRISDDIVLNDIVIVELLNIDESVYNYYNTLSSILGGERMSSSTPANPNSNISNGALGYFGAYSFTQDTIIIN